MPPRSRNPSNSCAIYPFGMVMPEREYSGGGYKFGFNGKEKDVDISEDNYDFGARIYDARVVRWFSVDPHSLKYSSLSTFVFCGNSPLIIVDKNGKDGELSGTGTLDDPYIIKANYAYVKGQLTQKQISGLNASATLYNNGGKSFKSGSNKSGYTYVKYDIQIIELAETVNLKDNNVKAELRADPKYQFVDENKNIRSSLNFVEQGNGTDCNAGDDLACTDNTTITLNIDAINSSIASAQKYIDQNASIECKNIEYYESNILQNTFNHELFHNLGGLHENEVPEMQIYTTKTIRNDLPNSLNPCIYTVEGTDLSPTKQGSVVLIENYSENNSKIKSDNSKAYGGTGAIYRRNKTE